MKAILIWLVFCSFPLPLSGRLATAAPADPEATTGYRILARQCSLPAGRQHRSAHFDHADV